MTTNWRDLNKDTRGAFLAWLGDAMFSRQEYGSKLYGDRFIGDPLQQAIEEQLDSLFYLWVAKRRHEAMRAGEGATQP